MKFNDITAEQWEELSPYLDTCLLPLTGLSGEEAPWEVTAQLKRLRDVMALIEQPYGGRVVTYPAVQYKSDAEYDVRLINDLCHRLKNNSFTFVIVVTADDAFPMEQLTEADLCIAAADEGLQSELIAQRIESMWQKSEEK